MERIDRTSSIEREPRALSFHQLQRARDLAIYVMNTNGVEEASRIFTEGLKPVVMSTKMDMDWGEEIDDQSLKDTSFRDIASAPF